MHLARAASPREEVQGRVQHWHVGGGFFVLLGLAAQLTDSARRLSSYGQEQLQWLDRELSEGRHTLLVVSWLPSDAHPVPGGFAAAAAGRALV